MSFIAKNPILATKLNDTPPIPSSGLRGIFAKEDGWYDVNDDGAVIKFISANDVVPCKNYETKDLNDLSDIPLVEGNVSELWISNKFTNYPYRKGNTNVGTCLVQVEVHKFSGFYYWTINQILFPTCANVNQYGIYMRYANGSSADAETIEDVIAIFAEGNHGLTDDTTWEKIGDTSEIENMISKLENDLSSVGKEIELLTTKGIYQSSSNFSIDSGDGTWDDGLWTAQVLDNDGNYTPITATGNDSDVQGDYWGRGSTYIIVNDKYISAANNGGGIYNTTDDSSFTAVKTFNAPMTGRVKITYGGHLASDNGGKTAFRVRKQSYTGELSQIYPTDGSYANSINASDYIEPIPPIEVELHKGDKLHFEVKRPDGYETKAYWCRILCDPIIAYMYTYVDADEALKKELIGTKDTVDNSEISIYGARAHAEHMAYDKCEEAKSYTDSILNNIESKLILTSPNGSRFRLTVDDNGVLSTEII